VHPASGREQGDEHQANRNASHRSPLIARRESLLLSFSLEARMTAREVQDRDDHTRDDEHGIQHRLSPLAGGEAGTGCGNGQLRRWDL
jgi:hypothetical protein